MLRVVLRCHFRVAIMLSACGQIDGRTQLMAGVVLLSAFQNEIGHRYVGKLDDGHGKKSLYIGKSAQSQIRIRVAPTLSMMGTEGNQYSKVRPLHVPHFRIMSIQTVRFCHGVMI